MLAAVFIGATFTGHYDVGAPLEWTIAFIFDLYIFSFCVDLYPAVHTRKGNKYVSKRRQAAAATAVGAPLPLDMEAVAEAGGRGPTARPVDSSRSSSGGSSGDRPVAAVEYQQHRRPLEVD